MRKNNEKRRIAIPLIPILLLLILLIVLMVNKLLFKEVEAKEETNIISNNIINSSFLEGISENIIKTNEDIISNNVQTDVVEENIVFDNSEVQSSTNNEESSEKSYNTNTHTLSNGETYQIIGNVNIPSLGINYPILSKTSTELLKISVTKFWGADPNEVGNLVVVGHNYENTKFFSKLPNIKQGDIIKITDLNNRTIDYTVYETDIVDPYDTSCTSQLTNGNTEVTLITCYNHSKERFVAKARANM